MYIAIYDRIQQSCILNHAHPPYDLGDNDPTFFDTIRILSSDGMGKTTYICKHLIDENNKTLIPENTKRVDIIFNGTCGVVPFCFKSIKLIINNMSIFPNSVECVTIDTYIKGDLVINGRFVFGSNIKRIHLYGRCSLPHNRIYLWPVDKKYTWFNHNLNYAVDYGIYIYHSIPFPIFEEFWDNARITVELPIDDIDTYNEKGNMV